MRKPPSFPLYADDFLSGTADMTAEEVGVYFRLLCHQWNKGSLPNDDARLSLMAGQCQASSLAHAKTKFRFCEDGALRNDRLEGERVKQAGFREKQAANGAKRWRGNAEPHAEPMPSLMPNVCPPVPVPSPDTATVLSRPAGAGERLEVAAAPLLAILEGTPGGPPTPPADPAGGEVPAKPAKAPKTGSGDGGRGLLHARFIAEWAAAFKNDRDAAYKFEGGRDGKAVKALLAFNEDVDELIALAQAAWKKTGPRFFWCEKAVTIASFASRLNEIRAELDALPANGHKKPSPYPELAAKEL